MAKKYKAKPVVVYKIGKWKDGEYRPERAVLKTKEKAIAKLLFANRWDKESKYCILMYECSTPVKMIATEDDNELVPLTKTSNFLYG